MLQDLETRRISDDPSFSEPRLSKIRSVSSILDRTDLKHDKSLNDRSSSFERFSNEETADIGTRGLFIVGHE